MPVVNVPIIDIKFAEQALDSSETLLSHLRCLFTSPNPQIAQIANEQIGMVTKMQVELRTAIQICAKSTLNEGKA